MIAHGKNTQFHLKVRKKRNLNIVMENLKGYFDLSTFVCNLFKSLFSETRSSLSFCDRRVSTKSVIQKNLTH